MHLYTLERQMIVRQPLTAAFDFFSKAENLERITPPWLNFRILTPLPIEMKQGAIIAYRLRLHGMTVNWLTEIERWKPPFEFVDIQVKGPYRSWRHTHTFSPVGANTRIIDAVDYSLPFSIVGRVIHRLIVRRQVENIFNYRNECIQALFDGCRQPNTA